MSQPNLTMIEALSNLRDKYPDKSILVDHAEFISFDVRPDGGFENGDNYYTIRVDDKTYRHESLPVVLNAALTG